jgi:hypothetical protein
VFKTEAGCLETDGETGGKTLEDGDKVVPMLTQSPSTVDVKFSTLVIIHCSFNFWRLRDRFAYHKGSCHLRFA